MNQSTTTSREKLNHLLAVTPDDWMMTPSERLVMTGILLTLRPRSVCELGYGKGGLTDLLSKFSDTVVTVDFGEQVLEASRRYTNVTGMQMDTAKAAKLFIEDRRKFDLTIVDAGHSTSDACQDLRNALDFSDVIVMHDTFNPDCRRGYIQAIEGKDVYANLDLVEGRIQIDGMWGGLGIVLPYLPKSTKTNVTPHTSCFELALKNIPKNKRGLRQLLGSVRRKLTGH